MKSIIKDNDEIYIALSQRKKELGLTNDKIKMEAELLGINLPRQSLSKFFTRKPKHNLTEAAILWMCDKYCIKVDVLVTKEPYSEFESKLKLKIKYP